MRDQLLPVILLEIVFHFEYHFFYNSGIQPEVTPTAPPVLEEEDELPPPEEPQEEAEASSGVERIHPDVPSLSEMPLPPGWAMQLAPNNRVFFINHNTRTTSWVSEF